MKEFADILGYSLEPIMLYQVRKLSADDHALDMISKRDFLTALKVLNVFASLKLCQA